MVLRWDGRGLLRCGGKVAYVKCFANEERWKGLESGQKPTDALFGTSRVFGAGAGILNAQA